MERVTELRIWLRSLIPCFTIIGTVNYQSLTIGRDRNSGIMHFFPKKVQLRKVKKACDHSSNSWNWRTARSKEKIDSNICENVNLPIPKLRNRVANFGSNLKVGSSGKSNEYKDCKIIDSNILDKYQENPSNKRAYRNSHHRKISIKKIPSDSWKYVNLKSRKRNSIRNSASLEFQKKLLQNTNIDNEDNQR